MTATPLPLAQELQDLRTAEIIAALDANLLRLVSWDWDVRVVRYPKVHPVLGMPDCEIPGCTKGTPLGEPVCIRLQEPLAAVQDALRGLRRRPEAGHVSPLRRTDALPGLGMPATAPPGDARTLHNPRESVADIVRADRGGLSAELPAERAARVRPLPGCRLLQAARLAADHRLRGPPRTAQPRTAPGDLLRRRGAVAPDDAGGGRQPRGQPARAARPAGRRSSFTACRSAPPGR